MNQLRTGIKIEAEHKPTYRFLKSYLKKHKGKLPPQRLFYKQIAQNHISEIPTYYTKLKKAKL